MGSMNYWKRNSSNILVCFNMWPKHTNIIDYGMTHPFTIDFETKHITSSIGLMGLRLLT